MTDQNDTPADVARMHMFPGGRLTDEGHRALARLAEKVPSASVDAYSCPYCPAIYPTAAERDEHQRSHGL